MKYVIMITTNITIDYLYVFFNREDGQPFIMQVTKDVQILSMY